LKNTLQGGERKEEISFPRRYTRYTRYTRPLSKSAAFEEKFSGGLIHLDGGLFL